MFPHLRCERINKIGSVTHNEFNFLVNNYIYQSRVEYEFINQIKMSFNNSCV